MKRVIRGSVTNSNNRPTKYTSSLESSDLKETAYAIANYMSNIDGIVNEDQPKVTIRKSGEGYNIYIRYRFGNFFNKSERHAERNLTILEEKGYYPGDVLTDRGKTLLQFFESVRQDLMNIHPDVDIRISHVRDGLYGMYGMGIGADLVVNVKRAIRGSVMNSEITNNEDDVEASEAVDNSEREFQRIDRSGTDEEYQLAAVMYNLGATMNEAREILPTLSEDKIQEYVDYYNLRHLPRSERVKIWDKRKVTSATDSEYALFKKTYSHSREFKDADKQSGSIHDLIDELENKDISYEIYYNKTDNGCTIFYDDDGTITASSEMRPRKFTYLESELANKSNDKRIYDAYQRGDLGIVQYGDVWYLEGGNVSESLFEVVKREMAAFFPELSYLHDIKASYGGAFDIEDDQYFTKDEIVEFGNTVCDHLNETFYDTYDVSDVHMETPKKLVLTVVQKSDESEFTATIDIDMRKIKKPADLMNRYLGDVVYALQQDIKAYNDEINASSDITSAQKTGVDEIKTKIWNAASAKMEDMGFPVDEIPEYLFVEVKQADDHIRVEVRAELTYNGLTNLTNELDPIVQSFDKDSYFEPVEPGIAEAYIWNLSKINSSETVEAGIYDVPDRPLDPPEDDSWKELDSDDEVIELTLDAIVHIDEDGSWEYDDTNYPWAASPDNKRGDWYTDEYSVYIGDKTSIVEYVDELLEPMMPAKAGEYHIKGDVTLVFSVEGIQVKRDYFWDERHGADYDEESYTDDAKTSFLYDKSHIKNFEITER